MSSLKAGISAHVCSLQPRSSFFLDADSEIRAARRQRELVTAGVSVQLDRTQQDIDTRDHRDRTRSLSPLTPARDAIVIDTSTLTVDEVIEKLMAVISSKQ